MTLRPCERSSSKVTELRLSGADDSGSRPGVGGGTGLNPDGMTSAAASGRRGNLVDRRLRGGRRRRERRRWNRRLARRRRRRRAAGGIARGRLGWRRGGPRWDADRAEHGFLRFAGALLGLAGALLGLLDAALHLFELALLLFFFGPRGFESFRGGGTRFGGLGPLVDFGQLALRLLHRALARFATLLDALLGEAQIGRGGARLGLRRGRLAERVQRRGRRLVLQPLGLLHATVGLGPDSLLLEAHGGNFLTYALFGGGRVGVGRRRRGLGGRGLLRGGRWWNRRRLDQAGGLADVERRGALGPRRREIADRRRRDVGRVGHRRGGGTDTPSSLAGGEAAAAAPSSITGSPNASSVSTSGTSLDGWSGRQSTRWSGRRSTPWSGCRRTLRPPRPEPRWSGHVRGRVRWRRGRRPGAARRRPVRGRACRPRT